MPHRPRCNPYYTPYENPYQNASQPSLAHSWLESLCESLLESLWECLTAFLGTVLIRVLIRVLTRMPHNPRFVDNMWLVGGCTSRAIDNLTCVTTHLRERWGIEVKEGNVEAMPFARARGLWLTSAEWTRGEVQGCPKEGCEASLWGIVVRIPIGILLGWS